MPARRPVLPSRSLRLGKGLALALLASVVPSWTSAARAESPRMVTDRRTRAQSFATLAELARPAMRLFTDRDGLPENAVMSLARDADGGLWAGTQDGLVRFDGRGFEVHDLPHRELSNFVRAVLVTRDGSVWCGRQDGGLARFEHGAFTTFDAASGLPARRVNALAETVDAAGVATLWVGTETGGLARLREGVFTVLDAARGLPSNQVHALLSTDRGMLVGTARGLVRVEGERVTPEPLVPVDVSIGALLETGAGAQRSLWVGTANHGLLHLHGGIVETLDRARGLPADDVTSLAETRAADGTATLWIGSDDGIVRLERDRVVPLWAQREVSSPSVYSFLTVAGAAATRELWIGFDGGLARIASSGWSSLGAREGLPAASVFAIAPTVENDGSDGVWLGTRTAGLVHLAKGTASVFGRAEGLPGDTVFALHDMARRGGGRTLLVGTQGGGLSALEDGQFRSLRGRASVRHFHEAVADDGAPEVYVSTGGQGLWRFHGGVVEDVPGLPVRESFCSLVTVSADGERALWVGTQGAGVVRRAGRELGDQDVFDTRRGGLLSDSVLSLHESRLPDGRRLLWAGTEGGGLAWLPLWDTRRGFSSLTGDTVPRLPNDTVYQVRGDAGGRLYGFTNKGAFRLTPHGDGADPSSYAIETFTTEDGLPANEFNGGASAVDAHGRIWAGSLGGAVFFEPAREVPEPVPKRVLLSGDFSGGELTPGASLAHDQASVRFSFGLPSLFRGAERAYRTELVGLGEPASPWSPEERRTFSALRDGSYELRVWGRDHAGHVVGPATLPFVVRPAPWRTPLAYGSYAVLLLGLGWLLVRLRLRALTARNETLEATVSARTAELADKVVALAAEERRARAAEEEARAASRAKSVFLSTMSHELRTPLNAILGFSQLLSRDRSAPRSQRESLDVIQRSGEHLLSLINDVLSMAKIEAGQIVLVEEPFDLRATVRATHAILRGRAEQKRITLACELPRALPAAVRGDEGKLRQILVNLVGNAIKFTERGGVVIRATWSDGVAIFEVEDTGRGIAEGEMSGLFDAFVQTESGRRAREGTGLGLTISQSFARKMGGEIRARSEAGVGSCFRVEIPLPAVAAVLPEAQTARVIGLVEGQGPVVVLVADDAADGRAVLRALLSRVGIVVIEAENGDQAIAAHLEHRPRASFLDMHMGETDGVMATRAIRLREAEQTEATRANGANGADPPPVRSALIALSASAFEEERRALLSAGCDAFLMKPFREESIFDALALHAGIRFRHDDEAPPSSSADSASPERLRRLPDDVRAGLRAAVTSGDVGASRAAVARVAEHDAILGAMLQSMVEGFDLEGIEARLSASEARQA